jgi:glucan-binding YG repeat protein
MARNEWITLDGKSYYLGSDGGMYVSEYTPDGYWVDSNGVWVQ